VSRPVESHSPVPIGSVLADKYVVERVLGVGGMGTVVAAHHRVLDQRVALKFLHGPALADPTIVERFIREARIVAKLESPFVARVSDVGVLDSGSPFIVMELLTGGDLAQRIEAYATLGPLPVADAVDRVLEALDALAEAHSLDVVHRDLKPANLYLAARADGTVATKVLDFGISKVMTVAEGPGPLSLTNDAAVMGTPHYMAPEQVRSAKSIDVRADIWAMGAVLYETLTGRAPFDGETVGAVFAAVLEKAPAPLSSLREGVPPELESVVLRCLSKDPVNRYADCAALAIALAPFGSGRAAASVARASAVLARRSRLLSGPDVNEVALRDASSGKGMPTATSGLSLGVERTRPTGRRNAAIAGALTGLAIAAIGAFIAFRDRPSEVHVQTGNVAASTGSTAATPPLPPLTESATESLPSASAPSVGAPTDLPPSASVTPSSTPMRATGSGAKPPRHGPIGPARAGDKTSGVPDDRQ
jgi:eukaryotic-like serine/threonine-protein kinase